MSNVFSLEDQIRESRRVRSLEEFPPDVILGVGVREQTIISVPLDSLSGIQQQKGTITIDMPSTTWELIPSKDPFSLSLEEFLMLDLNESEELLKKAFELSKDLLEDAWRNGFRQAVVCDGKIVFKTANSDDISDDEVEQLAKKHNKACYVFSAPDVVEESVWTPVSGEDSYPTLRVYLGTEDSDEEEIVEGSSPIYADLDTGNPFYKVFNANQLAEPLTRFTPLQMRRGEHLGRSYTYYSKRLKMCVEDISGNTSSIVCSVRLIRDWDDCALLQASPNRAGFVGRDILRSLRIRLKLDPIENTTQVIDVS